MPNGSVVLLVDDNKFTPNANQSALGGDGHTCISAKFLLQAGELKCAIEPNFIVFKIPPADGGGPGLLSEIRKCSDVPVFLLISADSLEDQIAGMLAGGNDYIVKPKDFAQSCSSVQNVIPLKHKIEQSAENITINKLTFNMDLRQAYYDGEDMQLSPKEFALLHLFATNEEKMLPSKYVYEKVWGHPAGSYKEPLKTAVSRLRKKLDETDFLIVAQRGAGYCFYRD